MDNSDLKTERSPASRSGRDSKLPEVTFSNSSVQTDASIEINIFKALFESMRQPAIIIDLESNDKYLKPLMMNSSASALCNHSFIKLLKESHLEKFNGSLWSLIGSLKKKVIINYAHSDIFHITMNSEGKDCEMIFGITASVIDLKNDSKILGILLIEISKNVKEQLSAVELFKSTLISSLSHELNNPINSLIPLLEMMPDHINKTTKENLKDMALSNGYILKHKIQDLIDYAKIETRNFKLE